MCGSTKPGTARRPSASSVKAATAAASAGPMLAKRLSAMPTSRRPSTPHNETFLTRISRCIARPCSEVGAGIPCCFPAISSIGAARGGDVRDAAVMVWPSSQATVSGCPLNTAVLTKHWACYFWSQCDDFPSRAGKDFGAMRWKAIPIIAAAATSCAAVAFAAGFTLPAAPKIAFLYFADKTDGGWTQAFDEARPKIEKTLDMQIPFVENVPEVAGQITPAAERFIQRGYNVIIGTAFGYSDTFKELSLKYPKVAFLNASGTTNGTNLE